VEIIDVLRDIGYRPTSEGNCYRMTANYRGGNNKTSLVVFKKDGGFIDYVTGEHGTLEQLVAKTMGTSIDEALKYCKKGGEIENKSQKEETEVLDKIDPKDIENFLPIYKFYNDKGISTETLKFFQSGYSPSGKMSDRYTFPIYDQYGRLVGMSGRDNTGKKEAKWKKVGKSRSWNYPFYFLKEDLEKSDSVIIVESIGDTLALYEAGIKNILCLCGKEIGKEMVKTIIGLNPKKIYLSLNNDEKKKDGSTPGIDAAFKIKTSLSKFFDVNNIEIKLPTKKDFGDMTKEEILDWKQNI
jgi:DNA primase